MGLISIANDTIKKDYCEGVQMTCVKCGKPVTDCNCVCNECMDELHALNKWQNEQWHTDYIICPYCGYENRDSWECDDEDDEFECDVCGEVFEYERNYEITYTSRKRMCDYESGENDNGSQAN